MKLSPSQIVTFDDSTPFGCRRKWWLKHVAKLPGVQNAGQVAGEQAHSILEEMLVPGGRSGWNEWQLRVAAACGGYVEDVKPNLLKVEEWMTMQLGEHSMRGRIDVILKDGVLDWKTTKKLEYAKTPLALKSDVQMLSYAKYLFETTLSHLSEMVVKHVYITTSFPTTVREVSTRVTREHVDNEFRMRIMPLVSEMEVAAKETDVAKVRPDLSKCRFCEYKEQCPQGATETMSIFEKILTSPASLISGGVHDGAARAAEARHASIVPPDASTEVLPAPKPTVSAEDIAALAAPAPAAPLEDLVGGVPAPKKTRKPRTMVVKDEGAPAPAPTPPARPSKMPQLESGPLPVLSPGRADRRVTLRVGLTLATAQFENVRLDAEVTENVYEESLESARERINNSLKKVLYEQAAEWVEQMKKLSGKK